MRANTNGLLHLVAALLLALLAMLGTGGGAQAGTFPVNSTADAITSNIQAHDLASNPSGPQGMTLSVAQTFSIPMRPGWNLISLPGEPVDVSVNAVFSDSDIDEIMTTAKTQGLSFSPLGLRSILFTGA